MRYRDNLPLVSANMLRMVYMLGSAIVLQLYLKDLGASPFQISLLESVFWAGLFVSSPLWGALSDASGRRKVFLSISILGAALLIPLYGFLSTPSMVVLLRFLFALIAAAFPPVALAVMSRDASRADRGQKTAAYNVSRAVGFFIGWGSAGIILELLGFQYTFYALAGVGILGFIATVLTKDIDHPSEITVQEVIRKARKRWTPSRHDQALKSHGLNYLLTGIFLRKAGVIGINSLIAVYAVDVLGFREAVLSMLIALNPLSQILFINLFGRLTDTYGRRKITLFGFLLTVPVPFLLTIAQTPLLFGAAFFLLGFSFAALVEGSTAFVGDVAPDGRQGEFMGFRKSSQGLAGILGPLLAGGIATIYGYTIMLYVIGVLLASAFLVSLYGTEESMDLPDIRESFAHDIVSAVHRHKINYLSRK